MQLAGDVGGTKTVLALVDQDGETTSERAYPSAEYDSLPQLVGEFLARCAEQPRRGCLAVAGPVRAGRSHITNRGWDVDPAQFDFELRLLNDVEATARSIPLLGADDLVTLQAGDPDSDGAVGVVAPGTGLGFALRLGGCAAPSEAGHATFAPCNERQRVWAARLEERFGRASRERACSGGTWPLLEEFVGGDPTAMFVEMLGAIAGDWALEIHATGGLYLAGGISPDLLPAPGFLESFQDKGRFRAFAERVPVHVIVDERAPLRGAIATLFR